MTKCFAQRWLALILNFFLAASAIAAPCDPPFGLTSLNIGTDHATLTWGHSSPASVSFFQLEIRPAGQNFTGHPTETGIAAPPFDLQNLLSGKTYRCKVRAVCGTDTSAWSTVTHSFRTLFENPMRCGEVYNLTDNLCPAPASQIYPIQISLPDTMLGSDVRLRAVRLVVDHPWRSDLIINLKAPDGTAVRLIEGLNAGDTSLGNPNLPCPAFLELTDDAGALPLGALYKISNPTGRYQPRNPLAPFNNGQNPNGLWLLDICDQRLGKVGSFRWAELVFENLNCPAPASVFVQNVQLNSAEIGWQTDSTSCDSLILEWGKQGFQPGDNAQQGNGAGLLKLPCPATSPLTISNLESFKWYEVYVRRQCQQGVWSPNSQPTKFFTDCPPTLSENFDSLPTCDKTCNVACPMPGSFWQNQVSGGDNFDWKVWANAGPSTPTCGPYTDANATPNGHYLYFETTCPPVGTKDSTAILRSGCVNVVAQAGQTCHFAFDYFMWNTSAAPTAYGKLQFEISLNGGLTWTNLLTISGVQPKGWKHAAVNLAPFNGQTAVFRFVASGTVNQNADIMLDNLRFYGSTDAGSPDFKFYRDADGDGFGDPANFLVKCSPGAPAGYVSDNTDCDDAHATAHLGGSEILCNSIDENCNGPADDQFVPLPAAKDTGVCAGQSILLKATTAPHGQFFWFENETGGQPIGSGATFSSQNLTQTSQFFLQDSFPTGGCASVRVPVTATVFANPRLLLDPDTAICKGWTLDLAALPVLDLEATNGAFSYHSALPATASTRVNPTLVSPNFTSIYYVVKTTAQGCSDLAQVKITVRPSPVAIIQNGDSTTVCKSAPKKLVGYASGGTLPYAWSWSNGLHFQNIDIQGNSVGGTTQNYILTVRDSFGCVGADVVKVHTLNSITRTEKTAVHHVTSCGGTDGSITLTPLDGTAPYRFDWSGSANGSLTNITATGTISNLKQGNYRITVTDATDGCSMVMPLIVLNAPGLSVNLDTVQNPPCAGGIGQILLNVQGQNPTFHWSNGATTQNLTGIGAGDFSVTVADGACQQVFQNLTLTEPAPLAVLPNKLDNVKCFGGTDGAVDIQPVGGTLPYTFSWSGGQHSEDLSGLPAGQFTVTVTDGHGCLSQKQFVVNQPLALVLAAENLGNVNCFGGADGSLVVHPTGGVGGNFYQWNTGANTPFLNSLAAGNFTATVTDANGCTATATTEITEPPLFDWQQIVVENPTCIGAKNGKITASPRGGVAPYSWFWGSGPATQLIDNLDIGTYHVTATDAHGCQIFAENLTLAAPQVMDILLDSLVPVRCFGEQNGKIAIHVAGGTGPFSTKWNQFADDFSIENLFPGAFTAVVTDAQGCTVARTFDMVQPANPLEIKVLAQTPPSCFGEFNGAIETEVDGGWPPYSFAWSNGKTTENIAELPDGQYAATVTDALGCQREIAPVALHQPAQIIAEPLPQNIPCNGQTGAIVVQNLAGGQPPFKFLWSRGDTTLSVYGLTAGSYSLSISDHAGCQLEFDSISIFDTNKDFKINTLGVQDVACFGEKTGQIVVELTGGKAPFRFAWDFLPNQYLTQNSVDTTRGLAPGLYHLVVIDADGCFTSAAQFFIQQNSQLIWGSATTTAARCFGDSTGQIFTEVSGGLPGYKFLWDNGLADANPVHLPAGKYRATVTDVAGCTLVSPQIKVGGPAGPLKIVTDEIYRDTCGNCLSAIYLHSEGGTPGYHYQWDDPDSSTTQDLENRCPGGYGVRVTDAHGCSQVAHYQLLPPQNPLNLTAHIRDVLCFGDSTGSIAVSPFGGGGGYSLLWNTGAVSDSIWHLAAGDFVLILSDLGGCSRFFGFQIDQPTAALSATFLADSLAAGWTLGASVSGGTSPYQVSWADAQGHPVLNPTGLASGTYFAAVLDGNGCQYFGQVVAGTSGTGDFQLLDNVRLTPNPASDKMVLEIGLAAPSSLSLAVFSAAGQRVFDLDFLEKMASRRVEFDVASWAAGVYFLKIRGESGGWRVLRFVKI